MAETLESLVQQNVNFLQEMSGEIEPFLETWQQLESCITDDLQQSEQACKAVLASAQGCIDRFEALRDPLKSAMENATQALQHLAGEVDQHCTASEGIRQRWSEALRAVEVAATQLLTSLQESSDGARAACQGLSSDIQDASERLQDFQSQCEDQCNSTNQSIDQRNSDWSEAAQRLKDANSEWIAKIGEESEELQSAIIGGSTGLRGDADAALPQWKEVAEGSLEDLAECLGDGFMGEFTDSSQCVTEALTGLEDVVGEQGKAFLDDVGEVLDSIQDVIQLVEQIRPVLELLKKLD